MTPFIVWLLAAPSARAEDVMFTSITDGSEVNSPVFGMAINGLVLPPPLPGVAYKVTITYPNGGSEVVIPDVTGFWHSAAPYDLPKPALEEASGVFRPFVADLVVTTVAGDVMKDRDVVNLLDTSTFLLENRLDRTSPEPEGIAYKVTARGVDAFDAGAFDAVAAEDDFSINEALADLVGVDGLATNDESCVVTLTEKELNTIWGDILAAVTAVNAEAGVALTALSTATAKLATIDEVCLEGLTPVVDSISLDDVEPDLVPVNGGIGVTFDPNPVTVSADGHLQTGARITVDLSGLLDPADETTYTVDIPIKPCTFSYDGTLSANELPYPLAGSGLEFLVLDGGQVDVTSDPAGYDAGGVCGWGIFDGLLQKSRENIDATIEQVVDDALDVPEDEFGIAETLDHAWRDVEGSAIDVVSIDETFAIATGRPMIYPANPDDETGSLWWVAMTDSDGDLLGATDYIWQGHSLIEPLGALSNAPLAKPYDIAVAITTAAMNQSLSSGADSSLMDFDGAPTWNDLGLCAKAPVGTPCTRVVRLSGKTLSLLSPKLKGLPAVRLEYTPVMAPVTVMQSVRQCDAKVFFALASYKMRLVDKATGLTWVEVTTGAAGDFNVLLTGDEGDYEFQTPAPAYRLTKYNEALGPWPLEVPFISKISPLLTPMLVQATAALDTWLAPEFQSVDFAGGVTQVDECNDLGTMYRYAEMD